MHQFYNFSIDPSGYDSQVSPDLLPFERSPLDEEEFSFLTSKLGQGLVSYIDGDLLD
jgi:hypothetical protein